MPRYDGWRRLSGDTAARPDLLDLGKQLLGEIEAQRRLSGVDTISIQRTTPDGSVVTARFIGNIPSIDVKAAKPVAGRPLREELAGIVFRPRQFGDAFGFGAKADTLLMVGERGEKPAFFAASYVTNGIAGGDYSKVFPDGLVLGGNLDWRNADESLALSWNGPATRYFPSDGVGDSRLYHNGRTIYDSKDSLGGYYADVCGAALRHAAGKHYLLVALFYWDAFKYEVRAYEIDSIRAPLIEPIGEVAGEVLATIDVSEFASFYYPTPILFNQSATEARTMLHRWAGTDLCDVFELVIDLADLADVATSETLEAHLSSSDDRTADTTALAYLNHWAKFAVQTSPAYVPLTGTYQRDQVPSVTSYRCAVDFRDDMPVYATYALPTYAEHIEHSATVVQSITNGATGTAEVNETRELTEMEGRLDVGGWLSLEATLHRTEANTGSSDSQHITTSEAFDQDSVATRLWWLDLRYSAAAVTRTTSNTSQQDDRASVSDQSQYRDELGNLLEQNVRITHHWTQTTSSESRTQVYMGGVLVDEVAKVVPEATVVLADTDTTTELDGGIWQLAGAEWGCLTLAASVFESHNYFWTPDTLSQCVVYLEVYDEGSDPTVGPALAPAPVVVDTTAFPGLADALATQWGIPAASPPGGWNTITDSPNDASRNGAWFAGNKGWLFSMRWVADGDAFQWHSSGGHIGGPTFDLDTLSGGHNADLFMPIWPLSQAIRAI